MKVIKEKKKVCITLRHNFMLKGTIYINQGERIFEFINDPREAFIPVTEVEVFTTEENGEYVLQPKLVSKKSSIVVIKSAILWIEEA